MHRLAEQWAAQRKPAFSRGRTHLVDSREEKSHVEKCATLLGCTSVISSPLPGKSRSLHTSTLVSWRMGPEAGVGNWHRAGVEDVVRFCATGLGGGFHALWQASLRPAA